MATGLPNRRMWVLWAVAGLLLASAAGLAMLRLQGGEGFGEAIHALGLDLARPDAYIRTPALSRLPRDLVKASVARDLLTEDFAFYYVDHEDRLGLRGALRRMAFEIGLLARLRAGRARATVCRAAPNPVAAPAKGPSLPFPPGGPCAWTLAWTAPR